MLTCASNRQKMKVTEILGMDLRTTTGARVFRRQIGGPINSESILLIYLL